eukprot:NODE_7_length_67686_cov_1.621421.p13 type:complete len:352 gc:universal NODE_7_length_67686_cov_1.621421:57943-58998(+)
MDDEKKDLKIQIPANKDLKSSVERKIPEDLKTDTFVAIVGQPLPQAGSTSPKPLIVNAEDNPALIKPPDQDPEGASPGYHERKVMDVLDGNNEDPFTLDSFKELILNHADQEKDYILARVITMDPKDNTRFYYSYYPGHNINKVLFRTQPEEGLLHRMKAKNPLNNMTIVGDVFYYAISCKQSEKVKRKDKSNDASPESIKSPRTIQRNAMSAKLKIILEQSPKSTYLVTRPDMHENEPLKTRRPSADDVFSYTKTAPNLSPSKLFHNSEFWQGWQNNLRAQKIELETLSAGTELDVSASLLSPKQVSYLNDRQSVSINDWISNHTTSKEKVFLIYLVSNHLLCTLYWQRR